ncbi:MAG: PilZ domain-containing protein [Candidatus Omnitrophota bacterium]
MEKLTVDNKRKFPRYETDAKIHFRIPYDFKAEVDFKIDEEVAEGREKNYIGFSSNISVQGLAFETVKRLECGDFLWIDLHIPKSKNIVFMQGEVCWCCPVAVPMDGKPAFHVGVRITKVDGVDVDQTVYFDKSYGVQWSELLERVLGGFCKVSRKKS